MSENRVMTKKQTRKMDRLVTSLIRLFIRFRGDKTLLKVEKVFIENGEKKYFRVEIMEVF